MAQVDIQPDGTAGKDAPIESSSPGTNYANDTRLTSGTFIFGTGNDRHLAQFDLSAIPGNVTITQAILRLTINNYYSTVTHNIHRVTASWAEATVNWTNQPSHDASPVTSLSVTGTGTWDFDITSLVQAWYDGSATNNGYKMIASSEGTGSLSGVEFCSSDHATPANRPLLRVTYSDGNDLGYAFFM